MTVDVHASLADLAERDRIANDLDQTLLVEAAAGTGKTSALVSRMVEVLRTGRATLGRMVAVTFTDAASGELKLRLRARIEEALEQSRHDSGSGRSKELLVAALAELEQAHIGTIHSFCSDLLRERPVEAEVDPLFETAPDDVASELLDRAFDRWFEAELDHPSPGVRRILRRRSRDGDGPRALLRQAAKDLADRRDFPSPWQRRSFAREPEIDSLIDEISAVGAFAALGGPDDSLRKSLAEIARFAGEVGRRETVRPRDYDGLEAELIDFAADRNGHWRWRGWEQGRRPYNFQQVRARRDRLHERLQAFAASAGADLAPELRDDLWPVVEEYQRLKERAGYLDFLDLLLKARDLVLGNSTVRRELQERITHIFVDEFQDTDPLQVEILLLLAADDPGETEWRRVRPIPGKLFLIADPKQSIYRFRRAEVELFEIVKQQLQASNAQVLPLSVSFRAVPEIQEAVNAAFAPCLRGESPGQASYVPLLPSRTDAEGQPSIVALPVPAPYGDFRRVVNFKIEDSLPQAVAAFIHWLVRESGWKVTERRRPESRVDVQARHVCLIFRRFRSFREDATRPYVRALEARGLPHVLVGGGSFHQREEVEAIRNALTAIERPDDELSMFATLRGPLFALGDAWLLAFREEVGSLHPFRQVPDHLDEPLREVAASLALLRDLHRGRNHRPIAATIDLLLKATRAHAGFANWRAGEQALANVMRITDLARRAERTHGLTSFRAFVDRLAEEAEHGEAGEAPTVEEGTEGVRIMTVHRAKGLEFPVVILADLTTPETHRDPTRTVDSERHLCAMRIAGCSPPELIDHADVEREREQQEAKRVLYVACTRARDLLVVPVVGDERRDGWLAPLHPVVYPPPSRAREPETAEPPGCPRFGVESVPGRPPDVRRPPGSVAPGLHRPESGTHRVVWWDPTVLTLDEPPAPGLRQQRLLEADEDGVAEQGGLASHASWQEARARSRASGEIPSVRVITATEHAVAAGEAVSEPGPAEPEIALERVTGAGPRPHGARFGTLVHALLAAIDLDGDAMSVRRAAELEGRVLGATPEEIDAAVETAARALAHPLLRRAAAAFVAGGCRREVPVVLRLENGALVEGIVDAAFFEETPEPTWTVLDFKTDVEIAGRLEDYRRQVALYVQAVARSTGVKTRGVLLQL